MGSQGRIVDASRFKYFSAIKPQMLSTTDDQIRQGAFNETFTGTVNEPTHVVDDACFVFPLPLMLRESGTKHNSYVIVFSIWNTMIGSVVVCLPWAFQQSGIALGVCICFSSFIVCFYTTRLIVISTGSDSDFTVTLKRYYGQVGYYAGIVFPALLMIGTMTALFVILSELSYPILLAIIDWCSPAAYKPPIQEEPTFKTFSSAYTSIALYLIFVGICSMRNLGCFIRLGSLGAIFVSMFVLAIIGLGAYELQNTDYQIGTTLQNKATLWENLHGVRTIVLATVNFSPLASLLNMGYFLHPLAVPIMRNAKYPENSTRNLFMGYTFVFLSYVIIGSLGYIGFIGTLFRKYFVHNRNSDHSGEISQNCLNMFDYSQPLVFVIRLAIFMLLFSTYPLLNLFVRTHIFNLIFQNKEVTRRDLIIVNSIVMVLPMAFSIWFPMIGAIMAYAGAFAGFAIIYCLPVIVYLKRLYSRLSDPIMSEALDHRGGNSTYSMLSQVESRRLAKSQSFLRNSAISLKPSPWQLSESGESPTTPAIATVASPVLSRSQKSGFTADEVPKEVSVSSVGGRRRRLCQFYCIALLHLLIPLYGLAICVFQTMPQWRLTQVHDGKFPVIPPIIKNFTIAGDSDH